MPVDDDPRVVDLLEQVRRGVGAPVVQSPNPVPAPVRCRLSARFVDRGEQTPGVVQAPAVTASF